MLFNSTQFLVFFPVVVVLYYLLPQRLKKYWLLVASYYFYMCWNARYALLLLFSTTVTYLSGRLMVIKQGRYKKLVVTISFVLNLGILFFFKYFNFVFTSIEVVANRLGIAFTPPRLDLLLPVGISFYIFQALSYTMDIYREKLEVEKNFFTYALYVSFFPQLVAGPIERSTSLLPQLRSTPPPRGGALETAHITQGLQLMLWGFFEKIVIADTAAGIVDCVYNNFETMNGLQIIGATMLFAFQIYCDFGGYSHIAIGAAQVLGFQLMDNFRQPYFSISVKEFWRRWHISLSTWFKDYLYIPLGGNRLGKLRSKCNILIVFLLSGLWHGASWNYVVWGGLNGLFQLGGQPEKGQENGVKKYLSMLVTFCLVDFTWLFFRAPGFRYGCRMLQRIWTLPQSWSVKENLVQMGFTKTNLAVLAIALLILFVVDILHENKVRIRDRLAAAPAWIRWGVYLAACEMILLEIVIRYGQPATAFLYFQF